MRDRLTLQNICDIAQIEIPEKFAGEKDQVISSFSCFGSRIEEKNSALFVRGLLESGKKASKAYNEKAARNGAKNGARYIFSTEQYYAENGEALPCIIVDDPSALFGKVSNCIRNKKINKENS